MRKGSHHTEEAKRKNALGHIGKKASVETRKKISVGNKKPNNGQFQRGHIPWHKGKRDVYPEEIRKKMGQPKKGKPNWRKGVVGYLPPEKHWNWKGGITPLHQKIRTSFEYKLWRKSVFERDGHKCIWCGETKNLNADHIKPFSLFPELRFAIDNGRTLCRKCHEKTDTFAGKINKYHG